MSARARHDQRPKPAQKWPRPLPINTARGERRRTISVPHGSVGSRWSKRMAASHAQLTGDVRGSGLIPADVSAMMPHHFLARRRPARHGERRLTDDDASIFRESAAASIIRRC